MPWRETFSGIHGFLRRSRMAYRRWKYGLKHVHPTFYVSDDCHISRDLVAGEYGFLGFGCYITKHVQLGPYVMIAPRVAITGGDHRFDIPGTPIVFSGREEIPATIVEGDVWVGYGAVILAGVRIGRGAVIAAGAVVTKDVPPYEIHGGVPARKIRSRFAPAEIEVHDEMLAKPPTPGKFSEFLF